MWDFFFVFGGWGGATVSSLFCLVTFFGGYHFSPTFLWVKPFKRFTCQVKQAASETSPFTAVKPRSFSRIFCPSKRSRGRNRSHMGPLKGHSFVNSHHCITHKAWDERVMFLLILPHGGSCPSRCSSRSWGWCGSQPSSSRRLPWRCGHVAHSQVHAICTVRILRTLSPLHISMSSSLDANLVLKNAVHQPTEQFVWTRVNQTCPGKTYRNQQWEMNIWKVGNHTYKTMSKPTYKPRSF